MTDLAAIETDPKRRAKILALQTSMEEGVKSGDLQEITEQESWVVHHFAPGLYARECHIKAGCTVVGKIHKHSHMNTISQGRVIVTTEHGEEPEEFVAPYSFVSKAGTKRAVYAVEDVIWTTYHPTEETDLAEIEKEVIAESYEELEALMYEQKKQLGMKS